MKHANLMSILMAHYMDNCLILSYCVTNLFNFYVSCSEVVVWVKDYVPNRGFVTRELRLSR